MSIKTVGIILITLFCTKASCRKSTAENAEGFMPLQHKPDLRGFSSDCRKFIKKEMRSKWLLHSSGECYYETPNFRERVISNDACFLRKKRAQIHTVFGKPVKVFTSGNIWESYYMGKECRSDYSYPNLQFQYNNEGVLLKISLGQRIVSH